MNETGVRCWRRGQWPYGPAMNDMASKKSYLALHLIFSPLILSPSNYVRMINWPARLSSSYPKMVCWKGSCYHPKWSSVSAYDSHFLHCMSDCLEVDETIRSRSTEHEVSLLPPSSDTRSAWIRSLGHCVRPFSIDLGFVTVATQLWIVTVFLIRTYSVTVTPRLQWQFW